METEPHTFERVGTFNKPRSATFSAFEEGSVECLNVLSDVSVGWFKCVLFMRFCVW